MGPIFYQDAIIDYYDFDAVAEMLIANGAKIGLEHVPFGRGTHHLDAADPACGMMVSRDLPNRENFHWIAKTLEFDFVIAATESDGPPPAAGELIATYAAKFPQDQLERSGFRSIVYYSKDQGAAMLRSKRVSHIAIFEPDIEGFSARLHQPLKSVMSLGHVVSWLACNPAVSQQDVDMIGQAWRKGVASGRVRAIYRRKGIARFWPRSP